jgi:hypothetical protein
VCLSSIIGVSQTADEVARQPNRFREQLLKLKEDSDLRGELQDTGIYKLLDPSHFPNLPEFPAEVPSTPWNLDELSNKDHESSDRKGIGAVETPSRFESGAIHISNPGVVSQKSILRNQPLISLAARVGCHISAWIVVFARVVIAVTISSEVLPNGWNCRPSGETAAFGVWVISWVADFAILKVVPGRHLHPSMFTKALLTDLAIFILIIVMQWSIFHRCECYSKNGLIVNPLQRPIGEKLDELFMHECLYITTGGIAFQSASCVAFSWWYIIAFRIYLQRDDGRSNIDPIGLVGSWLQNFFDFLERQRIRMLT